MKNVEGRMMNAGAPVEKLFAKRLVHAARLQTSSLTRRSSFIIPKPVLCESARSFFILHS
jgi:hypothetical protein